MFYVGGEVDAVGGGYPQAGPDDAFQMRVVPRGGVVERSRIFRGRQVSLETGNGYRGQKPERGQGGNPFNMVGRRKILRQKLFNSSATFLNYF